MAPLTLPSKKLDRAYEAVVKPIRNSPHQFPNEFPAKVTDTDEDREEYLKMSFFYHMNRPHTPHRPQLSYPEVILRLKDVLEEVLNQERGYKMAISTLDGSDEESSDVDEEEELEDEEGGNRDDEAMVEDIEEHQDHKDLVPDGSEGDESDHDENSSGSEVEEDENDESYENSIVDEATMVEDDEEHQEDEEVGNNKTGNNDRNSSIGESSMGAGRKDKNRKAKGGPNKVNNIKKGNSLRPKPDGVPALVKRFTSSLEEAAKALGITKKAAAARAVNLATFPHCTKCKGRKVGCNRRLWGHCQNCRNDEQCKPELERYRTARGIFGQMSKEMVYEI
ncbi:uncharacterized protein LY89DRAFT_676833 [Mollisia scopiformis]|uniref:Uncharacterized protein n=1 Tax=Mollisia scopiformis TaxID=149040 RepID=A0A132B837_MOLSC|nr:uncharacterized protein LY89DRAFT_676833 [Mollisia scopiformis]KUJ08413.1 hypothetical protein LY89DRAFT_676833 [Mollisia scopiformis]